MPVFTNSVVINAVPEVVFDFAADPRNEREWNEDLESLELITEGEPGEGTSYYAKWKSAPERVRVDTVEFERPNRIVRHNGGSLEVTVSFAMEPATGARGSHLSSTRRRTVRSRWCSRSSRRSSRRMPRAGCCSCGMRSSGAWRETPPTGRRPDVRPAAAGRRGSAPGP